jgi:sodium/potassium-transporting ATPase subunit alpha
LLQNADFDGDKPSGYTLTEAIKTGSKNTVEDGSLWYNGKATSSAQSYAAAIATGYVPYWPWRARASGFYDTNWFQASSSSLESNFGLSGTSDEILTAMQPTTTKFILTQATGTDSVEAAPDAESHFKDAIGIKTLAVANTQTVMGYVNAISSACSASSADFKTATTPLGNKIFQTTATNPTIRATTDCYAASDGSLGATTNFQQTGQKTTTSSTNSNLQSLYNYPFIAKDTTASTHVVHSNVASRMFQKEALHFSQGAFWGSIVIVQWADLVICKTRWLSLTTQGMSNGTMNFGLFFETWLSAVLAYSAFAQTAFKTRPIRLTHWFPAMPFSIFIFTYDETRKFLMRTTSEVTVSESGRSVRNPGWLEYNTYY